MALGPTSGADDDPDDAKKVLKWQEERIARRLRGQYESAALHLSNLVRMIPLLGSWLKSTAAA